jgi:hypothetical protein
MADTTHNAGSVLLVMALALSCPACGQSTVTLQAFRTEQQAQAHCPNDTVVWVDPQTGAYSLKGIGLYGSADASRYACRGEADRAGMHAVPR